MRDFIWLNDWWTVYGVLDPSINQIAYVGITRGAVSARLVQHRNDPSSTIYGYLRELKADGLEPSFCIFGYLPTEGAARHLESALITVLPHIYNRTHGREGWGFWWPYRSTRWACGEAVVRDLGEDFEYRRKAETKSNLGGAS